MELIVWPDLVGPCPLSDPEVATLNDRLSVLERHRS